MNIKYETLVRILDEIRNSAPDQFKSYKPAASDTEKLNAARANAFIHLYLMVKFGLLDFTERHQLLCDGKNDGGLDAYYIDDEKKKVFLIQSKFRTTDSNFEEKSITADELVRMDVDLIIKGKPFDSSGNSFNDKVVVFQRKLQSIRDIARYDFVVILLANLRKYNDSQVRQLIGGFDYEVFDFNRTYEELVFPMCSGTYFDPSEIKIPISLSQKAQPHLTQSVDTQYGSCDITVIYVPTLEIARILHKYKNSLLRFNPRNYMTLSRNPVNRKIKESITNLITNEFAILNNGMTVLADQVSISQSTGKENVGQLLLTNPQIINGGQTAYTLSHIYETEYKTSPHIFDGKEVMLRIVTLEDMSKAHLGFIELVSSSTNQQTPVKAADRRSNTEVFIKIQQLIYRDYGYLFERKEGEFFPGLESKLVKKAQIINRVDLLKAYLAYLGDPASTRSRGEGYLFSEGQIKKLFPDENVYQDVFFAYRLYTQLKFFARMHRRGKLGGPNRFGNAFRYGKYSVLAAVGMNKPTPPNKIEEIDDLAKKLIKKTLSKWRAFEKYAKQQSHNEVYFGGGLKDFDNYYKGKTLNLDIAAFFSN